jgi:hypothetical protein
MKAEVNQEVTAELAACTISTLVVELLLAE